MKNKWKKEGDKCISCKGAFVFFETLKNYVSCYRLFDKEGNEVAVLIKKSNAIGGT